MDPADVGRTLVALLRCVFAVTKYAESKLGGLNVPTDLTSTMRKTITAQSRRVRLEKREEDVICCCCCCCCLKSKRRENNVLFCIEVFVILGKKVIQSHSPPR